MSSKCMVDKPIVGKPIVDQPDKPIIIYTEGRLGLYSGFPRLRTTRMRREGEYYQ